jgi:Cu-Zn family superoxide dismutase
MKKVLSVCALTLLTSQAWAQAQNPQDLRDRAEEKTEGKMVADLKKGDTFAEATLAPKSGSKVSGTVLFNKTDKGLEVIASITGGTAGAHGIHIHEKGDCSAPDASSAGGHFNPTGAPHAGPDAPARHVGDLGNITINKDGKGILNLDVADVKGFTDWNSIIGKAVILHAKADDLKTQPTGDAGGRIACGVIGSAKKQAQK